MITDDARERFLREIVEHVPADRIAEVHLFRPLRRGGMETGVAVIAVEPEAAPRSHEAGHDSTSAEAASDESPSDEQGGESGVSAGENDDRDAIAGSPLLMTDARVIDTLEDEHDVDGASFIADDDSPYADARDAEDVVEDAEGQTPSEDLSLVQPAPARPARHTVFTARYRLTRKGVDRGKWEFEVVADADAPLGTVDTVVRGVQRRAGDDEEPERLTAEGVRAALDGLAWRQTT